MIANRKVQVKAGLTITPSIQLKVLNEYETFAASITYRT